ncbi:hypothetical protein FC85_GL001430 [Lentilactobacillus diolivorans DSM 14421]|uniref:Uncharacterized protein n=1 Tax=Lentilactobacillus diolivorans DSM 14421 TaxID=1423739 RepID=A0A0R1S5I5_9LACO|nr:hypothetical protein FC85_GL001430 [Lentilactobacillus diolivorans DSM 14421]
MTIYQKIFAIWVILLVGLLYAIVRKNKTQIAFCAVAWVGFTLSTFAGVVLVLK